MVLSNSRGPETLTGVVAGLGPAARADTVEDAAAHGDIVVVTIPLKAYRSVPTEPLKGKVVIDTNNYYPQRQEHLPDSHVVKAFNHITSAHLTADAKPAGTTGRRALAIAGDDEAAKATVAGLIDSFGFDVVDLGSLAESWRIEPGTPGYGPHQTASELREALASAER